MENTQDLSKLLQVVLEMGQEAGWDEDDLEYLASGEYADEALEEILDYVTKTGKTPDANLVRDIVLYIED